MATYYVSPTGDDTRSAAQAQVITTPWKTWAKGVAALGAGDTLYIRGGTYTSPLAPGASDWLVTFANRTGTALNPITVSAYPGEQPVLDLSGFSQANNTTVIRINRCVWTKFIGLWVKNALQTGANIIAGWDFHECTDITMDRCWVDNIGGAGIRQSQKNGLDTIDNARFTYINCDASRCGDANNTGGGVYGNADGFDCNLGTATYINCRAWWCSDDGFDCFNNDSLVIHKGCWAFWNGFVPGTFTDPGVQADGMGFKWGSTINNLSGSILRTYTQCLAFQNKAWGFDQNAARCKAQFYNNTCYNNKFNNTSNGGGSWATGYFPTVNPQVASIFRNNISYLDAIIVSDTTNIVCDHNSFAPNPAVSATPTAASFLSLSTTGVDGPRAADGSLPVLNFLRLSPTSNQKDKGIADATYTSLGLTFTGAAPDLGAYELGVGTTYFVSNTGVDSNAGTSTAAPWQTLVKVNSFAFLPGDTVSFQRGGTWKEGIGLIPRSGVSGSQVTYNAYGSGAKPIITGMADLTVWTNLGSNIWETTNAISTLGTCNLVSINGVNTAMGRFPNGTTTLSTDSGAMLITDNVGGASGPIGSQTMTDAGMPAAPSFVGGQICVRKNAFILDRNRIDTHSGGTMTFHRDFPNPIAFTIYPPGAGQAYFIQDHPSTLDIQNEWYYNRTTKKLRIFSTVSPTNIRIPIVEILVNCTSKSFITFDNLQFTYSNSQTFQLSASNTIKITNCDIRYSGYNVITLSDNCPNLFVDSCTVMDQQNSGVDDVYANGNSGFTITNNVFTNTAIFAGHGGSLDGSTNAIGVGGLLHTNNNGTINNNRVINSGYIGIFTVGGTFVCQNNFVDTFCTVKSDGGGIYTGKNDGVNRQILGNIVINGASQSQVMGIYLDDSAANCTVSGNSVYNVSNNAIFLHSAHQTSLTNNTCYAGQSSALNIIQDQDTVVAITNTGNIWVMRDNTSLGTMALQGFSDFITLWTACNNNVYANFFFNVAGNDSNAVYTTPAFNHFTLAAWKVASGKDAASTASPVTVTNLADVRFEYNDTFINKTISLGATYKDMRNVSYVNTITLTPFTSALLVRTSASTPRKKNRAYIIG